MMNHANNAVETARDYHEEVLDAAERELRNQLVQWGESVDDAVAWVYRNRGEIADVLCRAYPAGSSAAIDRAVEQVVTIDQLRELAAEILAPSPSAITVPASDEPYFGADALPF